MGQLVRIISGHWNKSPAGDWRFHGDPCDEEHYIVAKTNEEIQSLMSLVREEIGIGEHTPVVLSYQLPPNIVLPEPFTIDGTTFFSDGVTEEEHIAAILGDDEIDVSGPGHGEIFSEKNLVLVYRLALGIEKARSMFGTNMSRSNDLGDDGRDGNQNTKPPETEEPQESPSEQGVKDAELFLTASTKLLLKRKAAFVFFFLKFGCFLHNNAAKRLSRNAALISVSCSLGVMAMELGPGIPRRCSCGAVTIVLTSKTKENPSHRFYRCGAVFGENHVFKWVDDAHLEELEAMADKQFILEKELGEIKEDVLEIKKDIYEIVAVVGTLSELIRKLRNDDDIGVGTSTFIRFNTNLSNIYRKRPPPTEEITEEITFLQFGYVSCSLGVMATELGPGIPRRCPCGAVTIVLTSKTKENPGHRFYRCGAVFGENHVFKWVDDAHLEELEAMADKQSILEKELGEIKEDVLEIKKDISEIVAVVGTLSELIR
ncbi:hypothetical protein F2Q69_00024424, partial [Brassica cretica]